MSRRNHPLFARAFHRLTGLMERDLAVHRRALLAGLSGRVIEVGAGNGMNFRHYPDTVREVVAVEPDPYLRSKAEAAAQAASVTVIVRDGVAEDLAMQMLLDRSRIWPAIAGGCHCSRETVAAITAAGYEIEQVRSFDVGPAWSHTNPHVLGTARVTPPRPDPPRSPPAAPAPPPAPA